MQWYARCPSQAAHTSLADAPAGNRTQASNGARRQPVPGATPAPAWLLWLAAWVEGRAVAAAAAAAQRTELPRSLRQGRRQLWWAGCHRTSRL